MANKPDKWDIEVDFIAVGSGIGGLTGAIAAHDVGMKAIVLEKAPKLGGVAALSGGEIWVPNNHVMKRQGMPDSREEAKQYLDFLAGGFADSELAELYSDMAPEVCQYLEEKAGVRWKTIPKFADYFYPHCEGALPEGRYLETEIFKGSDLGEWEPLSRLTPHMPCGITAEEMFEWGGGASMLKWDFALLGQRMAEGSRTFGPGMMAYFIKAAMIDRQIPAYLDTSVKELVVENDTVIGVLAEREGNDFWVSASKGVLLAMGGYDWNDELTRYYEQMPEVHSACPPQITGDHLTFGCEIGAQIAVIPVGTLATMFGYNAPSEEAEGKPLWRLSAEGGYPHAIWVNKYGQRFCDESFYPQYSPSPHIWDGNKKEHTNYPVYMIFDQNHRDKYPIGHFPPGQDLPEELVAKADSLKELAQKAGVDADGLEAAVSRFNDLCKDGVDKDFGKGQFPWANFMTGDLTNKPNPNMGPLERAPFYCLKLSINSVGINSAGLKTNKNAEVMHVRGRPIPGLYAAGNTAAALDTGAGYQSGFACTRGMVWSYIAAKHAAGR
ncbi:MAG: FAD-binding protein [Chloroflexi bacterium]|nr:FAD-binding protein [Chloroflexota bacterium]